MDLGFYHLGNGITVCNKSVEINGDYECVAHIDVNRNISWRIEPGKRVRARVEAYAASADPCVSACQPDKVFATRGLI